MLWNMFFFDYFSTKKWEENHPWLSMFQVMAGQPPTRWWWHPIRSPDQSLDHGRPRMEPLNASACGGLGVFSRRSTCHWSRRPRYDMWIYIYILYIYILYIYGYVVYHDIFGGFLSHGGTPVIIQSSWSSMTTRIETDRVWGFPMT